MKTCDLHCCPSGALETRSNQSRGLRPWLLTSALPGLRLITGVVIACLLAAGVPAITFAQATKAPRRLAAVHLSDGQVLHGTVLLTPGIDFSLTAIPELGQKFSQTRTFNVDIVKGMSFTPFTLAALEPERMERPFKFDEKDRTKKIPTGEPYPVRELSCSVQLTNGQEFAGVLQSVVLYVQTMDADGFAGETKRFILKSKQVGKSGEKMAELLYITRIRMLDEGTNIAARLDIHLRECKLAEKDELAAITREALESVPVTATDKQGWYKVGSTFGENVFLAARKGNKYVVGWPAEGTEATKLFKSVDKHVQEIRDYFDERKLLGIIPNESGSRVLALVALRRHVPKNAALAGGEFDEQRKPMEFFRLSVWLWKRDPSTDTMILSKRGSFFRVRIEAGSKTPEAEVTQELWPIVQNGQQLTVGR